MGGCARSVRWRGVQDLEVLADKAEAVTVAPCNTLTEWRVSHSGLSDGRRSFASANDTPPFLGEAEKEWGTLRGSGWFRSADAWVPRSLSVPSTKGGVLFVWGGSKAFVGGVVARGEGGRLLPQTIPHPFSVKLRKNGAPSVAQDGSVVQMQWVPRSLSVPSTKGGVPFVWGGSEASVAELLLGRKAVVCFRKRYPTLSR